jgi:hypothetical protein
VIYQKVPTDSIPTDPLIPQNIPFHVEHINDTTAYRGDSEAAPLQFALAQNAPNPFNSITTISVSLAALGEIHLDIFDVQGRLVENIAQGVYSPGNYTFAWNATGRASGIYVCRLEANQQSRVRKMVYMR